MVTRITPREDVDRIAETIWNRNITDFDSFDAAWEGYMGDELSTAQESSFRLKVFDALQRDHPQVEKLGRKEFFEIAGGKSLRKDREQTAKTVTTDREEFLRKGARRVDFQGLDTKGGQKVKLRFEVQGRRKGRIVDARKTFHANTKGVRVEVLRDRKGRFVSAKARQ